MFVVTYVRATTTRTAARLLCTLSMLISTVRYKFIIARELNTHGTGLLVEDTEPNLQYTLASSHGPSASTSSYTALYKFRNL